MQKQLQNPSIFCIGTTKINKFVKTISKNAPQLKFSKKIFEKISIYLNTVITIVGN